MKTPKIFNYLLAIVAIAILIVPSKLLAGGVMLSAMTNFSSVDFDDEQVRDLADVVMDEAFTEPKLTAFHTIVQGLITGKQIVYAGLLEKITKADAGCGNGKTSKEIAFRQKAWDPKSVKVWLEMCADELDQTLMIYAKNMGTNVADLTDTKIKDFIVEHIKPAMNEDTLRIAWFNDTDASNISDSGGSNEITDGVDVTDYNMIDGFWKQIFAIGTADANRVSTIAANAQASYSLQDSVLAGNATVATELFADMLTKADPRLQGAGDKIILCTMSLFNKYADELEKATGVQSSYERIEGGFVALQRRGVKVIGWEFWDRTIRADYDNGTKYLMPHRAVLCSPKNLMIGIDESQALQDLEIWYSQDLETNNFRGKYKIDAKVGVDYMIQAAY